MSELENILQQVAAETVHRAVEAGGGIHRCFEKPHGIGAHTCVIVAIGTAQQILDLEAHVDQLMAPSTKVRHPNVIYGTKLQ